MFFTSKPVIIIKKNYDSLTIQSNMQHSHDSWF